jgi:hypothetical protein
MLTDVSRLRLLFVVTGGALGALAAVSLVLWLRSRGIWAVPPIVAAVLSVGGAGLFGTVWLVVERLEVRDAGLVLSPARRRALSGAMLVFIVAVGALAAVTTFAGMSEVLFRRMTFPGVAGSMILAHGAALVIGAEFLRCTIARTSRWSDRRHFAGVALVWATLSMMGVLLLWREWRRLDWP